MTIRQIKFNIFNRFIGLGFDTVKRYVRFITDAPEKEWNARMKMIECLADDYSYDNLKEFMSFLDEEGTDETSSIYANLLESHRVTIR